MATAIIHGIRVTGTPEELARLMELAKSADAQEPPRRHPRWIDKTGESAPAKEATV